MLTVSGEVKQSQPYRSYISGPCNCSYPCPSTGVCTDPCSAGDWAYTSHVCCGGPFRVQLGCSRLNTGLCPDIAGGASTTWNASNNTLQPDARTITCTYEASGFTTLADVVGWTTAFGTGAELTNQIMPNFCSQRSTTCAIDPQTGQPMDACSNFFDTGEGGNLCRTWANTAPSGIVDASKESYCSRNNTPDCLCLDRASNPVYQVAKIGNPFNDACWFIPCANPTSYLVTSDMINPSCPTTVCEVVNEIITQSGGTVNVQQLEEYISCPINGGGSSGFWSEYKWWIVGIVLGILALLIFVALAYYIFRRSRK